MKKMNNDAIKLFSIFKQWYRSPKYCNRNDFIAGLTHSFITKQGFKDDAIIELKNNNIIEEYSKNCYRMTQDTINDFMNYKHL